MREKSPELDKLQAALGRHFKSGSSLDPAKENDKQLPFMLISIEGEEAGGKTDLALRGPKKPWRGKAGLVYFHTDYGFDRVRQEVLKHIPKQNIIGIPYITPAIDKKKQWQKYAEEGMALHKGVWQPFMGIYHDAVKYARTIVLDTGGEFYQFLRICHFGKLHQNPQLNYGPVQAEYLSLVREAKRNHTNLILIHQRKDVWKNKVVDGEQKSFNTGERGIDGMNKINYLIDAFILAKSIPPQKKKVRNPKTRVMETVMVGERKWEVEVLMAKHDLSLNGMVFDSPSFADIAGMIKPEVDPEVWE